MQPDCMKILKAGAPMLPKNLHGLGFIDIIDGIRNRRKDSIKVMITKGLCTDKEREIVSQYRISNIV